MICTIIAITKGACRVRMHRSLRRLRSKAKERCSRRSNDPSMIDNKRLIAI